MKNFEDLGISDYLNIVRRRMWYLILSSLLVSATVVAYVWRMPSVYKSETTIQVSSRLLPEDYIASIVRESVADRIEFVKQQIRSRTFLERIVHEFQLYGEKPDHLDNAINAVSNRIEFTVVPPNIFRLGYSAADRNVAQAVARGLAARVMQLNQTFRKEKAHVADQFLDEQLRQAANDLSQAEKKLSEFSERQFQVASGQGVTFNTLSQAETDLAAVRTDLDRAIAERDSIQHRIAEQEQLKTVLSAPIPQARAAETQAPEPAVRRLSEQELKLAAKRADLQMLLSKYTPLHPDVTRLTREVRELELQVAQAEKIENSVDSTTPRSEPTGRVSEKAALPELQSSAVLLRAEMDLELNRLNREIVVKQQAVRDSSNKVALYRTRLNPPAAIAQELAALTRDQEAAKQRHSLLLNKKLTSDMASSVDSSEENVTFKIIDPANLPQNAISPNRRLLAAAGCLAGLLVGLGLAFVREHLDSTMHDEDDTAAQLKLPVLAAIPNVPALRTDKAPYRRSQSLSDLALSSGNVTFKLQAADTKLNSVIADSPTLAGGQFRLISANLSVMQKQRGVKKILMLSAVPNEGKTFSACCLAAILARESGGKVLLVDADLRTASASRMLGLSHQQLAGGLGAVLRREVEVERTIMKCMNLNLYFLPSGPTVGQPSELLNSPGLERVFGEISDRFDWVIVDSPPILVADALYLIPHCDTALLVVRADQTPLKIIDDSIQRIGRERICGVLLNDVRAIKTTRYYQHYQQYPQAVVRARN